MTTILKTTGLAATVAALAICAGEALAKVPPGPPRVSPMAAASQVVGVSEVAVTYSRPAVRDREIWGALVPWDQVWRTGANEATTIRFSDDVRINGEPLAAGTYALFTIPSRDEWTILFNREAEQWGAFNHDPAKDALSIKVRPREAPFQGRFWIGFPTVGADAVTVTLHWEKVSVPFEVVFDAQQAAMRRARDFVAAATPADGRMVWNWANYFHQNGFNIEEALQWATELSTAAPMYWTHALRARLLAQNGRHEEAVQAATTALERAAQEKDQPGVEADSANLASQLEEWKTAGEG